jgi:UDP-galactopyranose mutase
VVSTAVGDVARQYGELAAVEIAATRESFVAACDQALALARLKGPWLTAVDAALATMSWDETVARMNLQISRVLSGRVRTARSRLVESKIVAAPVIAPAGQAPTDERIAVAGLAQAAPAPRLTGRLAKRMLH